MRLPSLLLTGLVVACAQSVTVAPADDREPDSPAPAAEQPDEPEVKQPDADAAANEVFKRLDTNGDGKLTAAEAGDDRAPFFERLLRGGDADENGELTRAEFTAALKQNAGRPRLLDVIERFDTDGDGKLTLQEVPENLRGRIKPLFDHIGKEEVSIEELRRLVPAAPGAGEGGPRGPAFLRILDADRDGRLSREEWAAAAKKFDDLDRNGDGGLDVGELMGFGPGGGVAGAKALRAPALPRRGTAEAASASAAPPRDESAAGDTSDTASLAERLFARYDGDGDGKLSRAEAPEPMRRAFDRLDNDGDGGVSIQEFRAARDRIRPQP
ncbi:MAG: EF-hand domain-containing protein [Planctomycetes bacterium]|nr:EF-hand domain-containing protein [Planctomycetota bacterium]